VFAPIGSDRHGYHATQREAGMGDNCNKCDRSFDDEWVELSSLKDGWCTVCGVTGLLDKLKEDPEWDI